MSGGMEAGKEVSRVFPGALVASFRYWPQEAPVRGTRGVHCRNRRGFLTTTPGRPMSESEGKTELAGLARSIDALFSSATALSPSTPVASEITDDVTVDAAALPVEEMADVADVVAEPEVVPEVDESLLTPDPPLSDAPAAASASDAAAASDDDDDEPPPGPLDLAVDAFIAGDFELGDQIKTLADELLDEKELEPIARAVARLTLSAGTPPDPSTYAVVESIMSPMVLGRIALRMGTERDEDRRNDYFTVCSVIGKPMAVAIRNDLAESTERLARRIHFDALIHMGAASRSVIEEMAVDENRFLVRNAVAILGEIGGDRAAELVRSALANPDARVRREALLSLAKLGDESAGEVVGGLLDDTDTEVRMAAVIAAGQLKVERALRPLISMLDGSKDPDQCLPLIRALGQLGDPGAVVSIEKHAVRSLFSKPRTDVRIAAYRALNSIGTPHARRLLNQAVSDKDVEVKTAVKELLHMR